MNLQVVPKNLTSSMQLTLGNMALKETRKILLGLGLLTLTSLAIYPLSAFAEDRNAMGVVPSLLPISTDSAGSVISAQSYFEPKSTRYPLQQNWPTSVMLSQTDAKSLNLKVLTAHPWRIGFACSNGDSVRPVDQALLVKHNFAAGASKRTGIREYVLKENQDASLRSVGSLGYVHGDSSERDGRQAWSYSELNFSYSENDGVVVIQDGSNLDETEIFEPARMPGSNELVLRGSNAQAERFATEICGSSEKLEMILTQK